MRAAGALSPAIARRCFSLSAFTMFPLDEAVNSNPSRRSGNPYPFLNGGVGYERRHEGWTDQIALVAVRAKELAVPRQEVDGPNVYLRYRAERSLEVVLQAIGSDQTVRRTLQH